MAVKLETGKVELKTVQNIVSAVKVVATPDFVARAMDLNKTGNKVLAHLKRIFPRSPASYPDRDREPLYRGWTVFSYPPKGFGVNKGFTVRRKDSSLEDHLIIRALDQGSRAYDRIIPPGVRSAFLKTNKGFAPNRRKAGKIGDYVFVTGTGLILHYRKRQGLHFMDRTYDYAVGLMEEAKVKYANAARRKIIQSARA